MKKILVTGATGAMGAPLIDILSAFPDIEVFATSRSPHDGNKVRWLIGNAMNKEFFSEVLEQNCFDAIVDFNV